MAQHDDEPSYYYDEAGKEHVYDPQDEGRDEDQGEDQGRRRADGKQVLTFEDFSQDEGVPFEELFDRFIEWQDVYGKAFKHRLDHRITIPTERAIAVAFPSDWHIGNKGTDHRRLRDDVNLLCSHPRLFVALGGDPVDNFIFEKMASAAREQIGQVELQWVLFRGLVLKLMESQSLLWVSEGNHDAWTHRAAGIDGVLAALHGVKVVNTGEGGFIDLQVGAQHYGVYRKHKPGRFVSHLNSTHFLKQMLRMGTPWDWDIGISEHFHQPGLEVIEWRPGTGQNRVLITCGSYKTKDAYAEGLGYYGGGYGVPCVVLYPDRREMVPVMSIEQAITILNAPDAPPTPAFISHARIPTR